MKTRMKETALMLLGAVIVAFGYCNVHSQSAITEGGVLGMTLLVRQFFGVSPAVTEVVLDVIFYALGLAFLGRDFLARSLAATLCYAGSYAVFEKIGYVLPDMSHMPLLAAAVGALFVGVGVGLVVRADAAACGDDALALVISHKTGLSVSRAYLITDLTVLTLSLTYIPLVNVACSLLTVTLSSFIIGKIHAFGRNAKRDG